MKTSGGKFKVECNGRRYANFATGGHAIRFAEMQSKLGAIWQVSESDKHGLTICTCINGESTYTERGKQLAGEKK